MKHKNRLANPRAWWVMPAVILGAVIYAVFLFVSVAFVAGEIARVL